MRLLARREHGAHELANKLSLKGYIQGDIDTVILECQRLDLQNDQRFVENVCRARTRQGYGPLKIRQELQQLQIDHDLIESVLYQEQDWLTHAKTVWEKKYNRCSEHLESSYMDIQKQKKFLLYRGFPTDIITTLFKDRV